MAEVRELIIPLRAAWNVPRTIRANRAIAEIKNHVSQHMKKTENERVWIDEEINQLIWARGAQKPPRKIKVVCTREEGFNILEVKLLEE
ncbi:50S ribosomal protein L31e [Euryarchaeota archaeon]|jgi:large subunit ribosomal protein L31e|nr:50S ribosomal protein L31e [Candidatus Thalassarchaeaceae archaeon]MDC1419239.1 50S ribosomal protein L31e [Euryarchaeota archaeon]|tara:strand:- start:635 stop:901 length:267 start_codon:yes stop_codon:yes gene_type:complete